jgi:tetratricopeptide (TPR) repeat protein
MHNHGNDNEVNLSSESKQLDQKEELARRCLLDADEESRQKGRHEEIADILLAFASFYRSCRSGERKQNKARAVNYYKKAIAAIDKDMFPEKWADSHYGLGTLYLTLPMTMEDQDYCELAIDHLNKAQQIYRDRDPESWHAAHLHLSLAYMRRRVGEPTVNTKYAEEHRRMAFDFNHNKKPDLYESLLRLEALFKRLYGIDDEILQS